MAVDSSSFEGDLSNVKTAVNQLDDHAILEEHTYSDLFCFCDETAAEVPDTEINLKRPKLCNFWDSPEKKKYKPTNTDTAQKQNLPDSNENGIELHSYHETSTYSIKKNKRIKSKLLKRNRSHKSLNILSPFPQNDQLPEQPVPPNSPCNGTSPDISCDDPFIACLFDMLEKTRMNSLRHESTALQCTITLLPETLDDVGTNVCLTKEIPVPDAKGQTACVLEFSHDDDHTVPQVSQLVNAPSESSTSTVFYDNELPLLQRHRVMQSCISHDHIVPDVIEE